MRSEPADIHVGLAREAGARVSIDLASAGPLLARGRRAAQSLIADAAPDLLFTNQDEAGAFVGGPDPARLLGFAPIAIVKRGAAGATVLARAGHSGPPLRFDVATRPLVPTDTTGAGDAFDAGFLARWLAFEIAAASAPGALRRAVSAGHRAAARQLTAPRSELAF